MLAQVKLLDFSQQRIAMNTQYAGRGRLVPARFLQDSANILAFELLHRLAEIITFGVELFDQGRVR